MCTGCALTDATIGPFPCSNSGKKGEIRLELLPCNVLVSILCVLPILVDLSTGTALIPRGCFRIYHSIIQNTNKGQCRNVDIHEIGQLFGGVP